MIQDATDLRHLPEPLTTRSETFPTWRDALGVTAYGLISSTAARVNIMGSAINSLNVYLPPARTRARGVTLEKHLQACVRVAYARCAGWPARRGIGAVVVWQESPGRYRFRVQAATVW